MKIRRIATAAATMMVAIVVALAVPVSQLRTVQTIHERCCCPDPDHCHCPTERPSAPSHDAQIKDCHRVAHDVLAPQLPAFSSPVIALASAQVRIVALPSSPLAAPHLAPAGRRPDAPS